MNNYVVDCNVLRRNDRIRSEVDVYVVLESDFDAMEKERDTALSQLAALREERDQWRGMVGHICATIPLADVLASTATGQKTVDYFKALQQRLSDAERQNSELIELLTATSSPVVDGELFTMDRFQARANARTYLAALTKPEEAKS